MKYRWFGPVLALLLVLLYFGAELYLFERPAFPLDDSWIHLQFARHLAQGNGLVYNVGERVNGSTSPLWTAVLSLGFLLPGGLPLLWPKLLGIALFLTGVRATVHLAAALGLGRWSQSMAGLMVAGCHWWAWSALSGMEILLFSNLAIWGLILHQREADDEHAAPISVAVLAVACLARPEGLLLWALAVGERILDERARLSRTMPGLAVGLMVLSSVLLYNIWVGGSPLPTTFHAKTHTDWVLVPNAGYLRSVLNVLWDAQPILSLLALAGGIRLAAHADVLRPPRLLPVLWLIGQPLAYSILTSPQGPQPLGNFGRYYFPLVPVVVVLGLAALEPLLSAPALALRRWRLSWTPLLTILLLTPMAFSVWKGPGRYLQTVANVEDSDVRMARWLQQRLPPGARLAAQDIGALKFFLPDHYFVDLAGIITPETRRILHRSMQARSGANGGSEPYWELQLADYLQRSQVDYVVLFEESYPALSRSPDLGFARMHQIAIERNVTMAGKTLVVLRTPWSRGPLLQD